MFSAIRLAVFLSAISLLAACASNPSGQQAALAALNITQALQIPAGTTHINFHAGKLGKGARFDAYCRLDLHAPLVGAKVISPATYQIVKWWQEYVQDDLLGGAAAISTTISGSIHHGSGFGVFGWFDERPLFAMLSLKIQGADERLRNLTCFQEHQSRLFAKPFSLQALKSVLPSHIKLLPH